MLWSPLFLMADSGVGELDDSVVAKLVSPGAASWSQRLGLSGVGVAWSFFSVWPWAPLSTAFLVFEAFALASAVGEAGASFCAFGAIFVKSPK